MAGVPTLSTPSDHSPAPTDRPAGRSVDVADLYTLIAFLKLLPGVQPRLAKRDLEDLFAEAVLGEKDEFRVGAERVTVAEANAFFLTNAWHTDHVSPEGAATLLRLYAARALPMKGAPGIVPTAATDYAGSQAALEGQARERREAHDAEAAAYQAKLANPAGIAESEFSHRLLDDLFWRHQGKGEGFMAVGGLVVHKTLRRYSSNSRQSHDHAVTFSWQGTDGERRSLVKPSQYEGNRHNDPERNWGLPE